jgi:hypothetical protein
MEDIRVRQIGSRRLGPVQPGYSAIRNGDESRFLKEEKERERERG